MEHLRGLYLCASSGIKW